MKKFVKNFCLFLGILAIIIISLILLDRFVAKNQYEGSYTAAIQDKLERLKSLDSPKIVIVGNSNLAFGINSELIENELEMPVVNLGLHGGIGDAYYEELIKPYIEEGDIVIIAPSSMEGDEKFPDPSLAFTMLEKNEELWRCFDLKEDYELFRAYPYYLYSSLARFITFTGNKGERTSYSRDAFNEYGDIVKRPEEYQKSTQELFENTTSLKVPTPDAEFYKRINSLNDYVSSKGAALLLAAYPIADCSNTPDMQEYKNLERTLDENLECEIISSYEDYMMSPSLFYDTVLHLTSEGADVRTLQLISDIKAYLNK